MKKITLSLTCFLLSLFVMASSVPEKSVPSEVKINAKSILVPIGSTGKTISLFELSKLSRTELETLTGKPMSAGERFAFNRTKKKLAKAIQPDGIIKDKKLAKAFNRQEKDRTRGFHGLGFILGFFLGVIGVVLAYVINDEDDKQNRVKWAWIGFGISFLLTIGLYILLFSLVV